MRATGSPARRRRASASISAVSTPDSARSAAAASAACSRARAWPTSTRASSSGASRPAVRNARARLRRIAPTSMPSRLFGGEQRRLMLGHQRVDDLAQRLAGDHLRQLVEREVDAVVAHPPLGEIVGADALGAVAGADLAAPIGGALGIAPGALGVVELGAQQRQRLGAVAMLRPLLLHDDDDAARDMGETHRRFGLVD